MRQRGAMVCSWGRKQQLLTNPTVDVWEIHVTVNNL